MINNVLSRAWNIISQGQLIKKIIHFIDWSDYNQPPPAQHQPTHQQQPQQQNWAQWQQQQPQTVQTSQTQGASNQAPVAQHWDNNWPQQVNYNIISCKKNRKILNNTLFNLYL